MAAIFGLFASERATARPAYSLPKLQALHERLQSILEADEQTEAAVEVIREMTEALLWGEQNDHNENFFDFFCEKSILADFVRILGRPVPKTVKVQLLQSLSMLIQNIRRPTSLYYLFSNNYVNQLIATQFDWSDEEILGYYISFLKSLALRLNEETIKFFFQERSQQFPLFTEAVRFFSHHDQMVRTSVRTLTLRVFNVKDEAMQSFVLKISRPYFRHLAEHLCLLWRTLDESKGQPNALDEANAEQQDLVMYISDVLEMKNANLSRIVVKMVLDHACYPMLLESLAAEDQSLLSWRTALFLLQEFFQTSQQRELVEPLATSLLATPGAASAPARSSTSSRSTLKEAVDVWEPFKAEDPEESVGVTVNAFSELYRPKILGHLLKEEPLLTAALLRSCLGLGISNLLEQGLLIEAGLLPPLPGHAVTTPAAPAAPPLEVLHRAAAALEDHSSLNMVAIQALARLCLDVAFTPEARSLSGSKDWREKPLEAIQRGLRSAAQQVRSFIHHLGDGFLDLFGEAWEQEH
ncbi:Protein CLEC16A (C-type lectin domain family 16 member A), partial [Durusdinium trenchii]